MTEEAISQACILLFQQQVVLPLATLKCVAIIFLQELRYLPGYLLTYFQVQEIVSTLLLPKKLFLHVG